MRLRIIFDFKQLLNIVKALPGTEKEKLRCELQNTCKRKTNDELERLLLSGPVATEKQLKGFSKMRKHINNWRP